MARPIHSSVSPIEDQFGGLLYKGLVEQRKRPYDPYDKTCVDDAPPEAQGGPYVPLRCGESQSSCKVYFFDEECTLPIPVYSQPQCELHCDGDDEAAAYSIAPYERCKRIMDPAKKARIDAVIAEFESQFPERPMAALMDPEDSNRTMLPAPKLTQSCLTEADIEAAIQFVAEDARESVRADNVIGPAKARFDLDG